MVTKYETAKGTSGYRNHIAPAAGYGPIGRLGCAPEERANAAMPMQAQPRSAVRVLVRLPAWVTLETRESEHVAFVRDISPRGIFFYSDFLPCEGDRIGFVLEYLSGGNKIRLHLQGTVVRLEGSGEAHIGVAVAFDAHFENMRPLPTRSGTMG